MAAVVNGRRELGQARHLAALDDEIGEQRQDRKKRNEKNGGEEREDDGEPRRRSSVAEELESAIEGLAFHDAVPRMSSPSL